MTNLAKPNQRVDFVDSNNKITTFWLRVLNDIYDRVGGGTAPSILDLTIDMPEDSGLEELRAQVFAFIDALSKDPPNIPFTQENDTQPPGAAFFMPAQDMETQVRALAEEIALLRTEINGLKQGLSL